MSLAASPIAMRENLLDIAKYLRIHDLAAEFQYYTHDSFKPISIIDLEYW